MLHHQLKESTATSHSALEKVLVQRIKSIRSSEEYSKLLKILYGYYAALEDRVAPHAQAISDFQQRRKASAILGDLRTLGATDEVKTCDQLPEINSTYAAIGATYVMEGSTLGGQIIAKMISGQLQLDGKMSALSFFLSYGDNTRQMWEKFLKTLTQQYSEAERQEIINTAEETFITFKNWMNAHQ